MIFFLRRKKYMRISILSIYMELCVCERAKPIFLMNLEIIFLFDSSRAFARQ